MSDTRIICEGGCGFPRAFCECKRVPSLIPRIGRGRRGTWQTNRFRFLGTTRQVTNAPSLWHLLRVLWRNCYGPSAIRKRLAWRRLYRSHLPRDMYEILHGRLPR